MDRITLEYVIEALSGHAVDGSTPLGVPVYDSRDIGPGGLFVALRGENGDGHEYVAKAVQSGATAVIIDREVDAAGVMIDLRSGADLSRITSPVSTPALLLVDNALLALQEAARRWCHRWLDGGNRRIIGITGSVGKTTTKELAADVLEMGFNTLRSQKSYNNEIGIPLTVLQLTGEHERAVLEMSMYVPGEIDLLTSIAPPQVGVVTLIAPVHLERAGSMEAIIKAKTELVVALPDAPDGVAILNYDDENVMGMQAHTGARIFTYGLNMGADLRATGVESMGLSGIRFWLHHEGRQFHVSLPMLGQHSVHTALRAAAVGLVEGIPWDDIITRLQSRHSQLRLMAVTGPHESILLDDTYNASPPSTIAALNLLNDIMDGRKIAVLGDMLELGSYEEQGHRDVGMRAAAVADVLVTVGARGRIIAEEALRNRMQPENVIQHDTAEEATAYLSGFIKAGDAVLVKGSRAVGMDKIVSLLQVTGK